ISGGSVAHRGTLGSVYGPAALRALADEYRRVLSEYGAQREWIDEVVDPLAEYQDAPLLHLLMGLDGTPLVIKGLPLGYPPEVTAGNLLHCRVTQCEACYAEGGARCVGDADRIDDLPRRGSTPRQRAATRQL